MFSRGESSEPSNGLCMRDEEKEKTKKTPSPLDFQFLVSLTDVGKIRRYVAK